LVGVLGVGLRGVARMCGIVEIVEIVDLVERVGVALV
jgi:hypothetical protein